MAELGGHRCGRDEEEEEEEDGDGDGGDDDRGGRGHVVRCLGGLWGRESLLATNGTICFDLLALVIYRTFGSKMTHLSILFTTTY